MKIAIINTVYETGSTGSMTKGLYEYFKDKNHDVRVYYGRGNNVQNSDVRKFNSTFEVYAHALLSRLTGLQGYFSNYATNKLIKELKEFEVDAVILLNLHGYYINEKKILNYLKENNITTIYIMPDEYPFLGSCIYSKECEEYKKECRNCSKGKDYPKSLFFSQGNRIFNRKKEIYNGFENIRFVGPTHNILKAKESSLLREKELVEADWGIDIENTYHYRDSKRVCEKYNIPNDKKVVLAVASFKDKRKAIKEFFYPCVLGTKNKDLFFVNVGYDGDEDQLPDNFLGIPYVKEQSELAELYSRADVFVITSMSDTMPLACLIALACGTPIISFDTSGLSYVFDERCGVKVPKGDLKKLQKIIDNTEKNTMERRKEIMEYAKTRYSEQAFYKKIEALL